MCMLWDDIISKDITSEEYVRAFFTRDDVLPNYIGDAFPNNAIIHYCALFIDTAGIFTIHRVTKVWPIFQCYVIIYCIEVNKDEILFQPPNRGSMSLRDVALDHGPGKSWGRHWYVFNTVNIIINVSLYNHVKLENIIWYLYWTSL